MKFLITPAVAAALVRSCGANIDQVGAQTDGNDPVSVRRRRRLRSVDHDQSEGIVAADAAEFLSVSRSNFRNGASTVPRGSELADDQDQEENVAQTGQVNVQDGDILLLRCDPTTTPSGDVQVSRLQECPKDTHICVRMGPFDNDHKVQEENGGTGVCVEQRLLVDATGADATDVDEILGRVGRLKTPKASKFKSSKGKKNKMPTSKQPSPPSSSNDVGAPSSSTSKKDAGKGNSKSSAPSTSPSESPSTPPSASPTKMPSVPPSSAPSMECYTGSGAGAIQYCADTGRECCVGTNVCNFTLATICKVSELFY